MGIKNSIWAILFISVSGIAQTDTISNAYYKEFKNMLSVQAFTFNAFNNFTLEYKEENTVLDIIPNEKTTVGIAFQYGIIGFSLGFAPKIFDDNRDNENSKMTSFSFNMFPGRFMFNFDLYSQKGVTVQEQGGSSVYLQDFKTFKIGGSTAYFFNKNFSYSASALQNTKQLKSAGSFAPTISYYYTEFNAKNEPLIESEETSFIYTSIGPAYYYNWVINDNFLLSTGGSIGGGIAITSEENTTSRFLVSASVLLAAGYNFEHWYGGLNISAKSFNHGEESNVQMNDAIGHATLFIGYRFDEPAFLKRKREKIEAKVKRLL
ncbi:hypothetical protein GCM10007424_17620 [Flavobacterium suaedae]|uniref:DUF4421 domain-containing protein n=1 Tax=Flavobacterium suaedae TaxID=1767027 RepID=A0ABQ1JV65_9FLAO|nr:DUF4421 family protein [Flavobacterium suaedae]GGB78011.1 hypothetical protein GCM10007424_17620 [Flavobacterium suaedae]